MPEWSNAADQRVHWKKKVYQWAKVAAKQRRLRFKKCVQAQGAKQHILRRLRCELFHIFALTHGAEAQNLDTKKDFGTGG
jgi:hypothetical protein